MVITSSSNDKLKNIKKLSKSSRERNEQGLYIIEGIRMFREIPTEDIHSVYVSESAVERFEAELTDALGETYAEADNFFVVSDRLFESISDTGTPQGILALVKMRKLCIDDVLYAEDINCNDKKVGKGDLANPDNKQGNNTDLFILIIEKLRDPGNLGTIIRTAEGAGVTGIIISSDSVDIYNPKVVRSTMGSIFRVPIYISDNLVEDIKALKEKGITVYGAHLKGKNIYDKDFTTSCAFLIGNEGNGLSDEVSSTADELIKIPMKGKVESLNAATSTAVIAYEVLRQRSYYGKS
ncbi:MAG: RNA methyltransferase [Lachnospiraceae bacterium]|nr:RNA methyltransferase [Lachnospiraceae bacterium]